MNGHRHKEVRRSYHPYACLRWAGVDVFLAQGGDIPCNRARSKAGKGQAVEHGSGHDQRSGDGGGDFA